MLLAHTSARWKWLNRRRKSPPARRQYSNTLHNFEQAANLISDIREEPTLAYREQDLELLNQSEIARAEGDEEAAVEILNKIVERDALNGEAIIELANYYADKDMLPEAINRYEQAAKIDAFERQALIAHGQTLVRKAQYRKALPLLKRANSKPSPILRITPPA